MDVGVDAFGLQRGRLGGSERGAARIAVGSIRETGEIGDAFEQFYITSAPRIIALLTITLVVLYALRNLYSDDRFFKKQPAGWNLLVSNLLALALFYAYFYLRRNDFHPRSMFAMMLACNVVYGTILRSASEALLRRLRVRFNWDRRPVILIGRNRHAARIARLGPLASDDEVEAFWKRHGLR